MCYLSQLSSQMRHKRSFSTSHSFFLENDSSMSVRILVCTIHEPSMGERIY